MEFKNVLIFGDSYSTFNGYIPKGYAAYYSETGGTDVRNVNETWWHRLISETDSELVLNDSWSGSTICYTGYQNTDCSQTSSFICRLNKLIAGGFFKENEINTVFVFGGTNDSWSNAPIGELKFSDWEKQDLYNVLPAICHFIFKLKETLPAARIVWLMNSGLKPEISDGMKTACEYYDITSIKFDCIDKIEGHPTVKGMEDIKNQILRDLNN